MSAALKSTLKRNDIFIFEDLVKDNFASPLNEKSVFLSSMKKIKFNKKRSKLLFRQKTFQNGQKSSYTKKH